MGFHIDLDKVRDGMMANYDVVMNEITSWGRHGVVVLKSNTKTALPYLQDKRIAVAALMTTTIVLNLLGKLLASGVNALLPKRTSKALKDTVAMYIQIGTLAAGVTAFAYYSQLPLSKELTIAIAIGTAFVTSPILSSLFSTSGSNLSRL